jgi:hypothetical protein
MSYFGHAFQKMFIGTTALNTTTTDTSADIAEDTVGTFALTDCNYNVVSAASADVTAGKPLYLVATSVLPNDKIGPFHGGYKETNKSKMINPKYVSDFWRVDDVTPVNQIVALGRTSATPDADCPCFTCDETYDVRIDIKGSPALRFMNHNIYENLSFYTGCCPTDPSASTNVDPVTVMLGFLNYLSTDPILPTMVRAGVEATVNLTDEGGETSATWILYVPDTMSQADRIALRDSLIEAGSEIDADAIPLDASSYVSAYDADSAADICGGLVIEAAYVETKFGNCTFQPCDFYERQPLQIYASLIDHEGNPCPTCSNLEVTTIQEALQGQGFGETVVRELILSESYLQNHFHTGDERIREITQGYDILGAVDRNTLYTRYYIKHSVPRFNNPSGTFDNDQYVLCIVTAAPIAGFETLMSTWLAAAGTPVTLKTY